MLIGIFCPLKVFLKMPFTQIFLHSPSDGRSQLYRDAYRRRNVVERCFGRLKEYRRIATRYEKTARNYLAMVKLGCIGFVE
ncbi:transposase [Symbiopectobacterium purcellii]|uniref:transposase n=1 Tax=Symbiopectobacterium purcellii TaxID=2871826 RepID=UPI003F8396A6